MRIIVCYGDWGPRVLENSPGMIYTRNQGATSVFQMEGCYALSSHLSSQEHTPRSVTPKVAK